MFFNFIWMYSVENRGVTEKFLLQKRSFSAREENIELKLIRIIVLIAIYQLLIQL